MAVKNNEEEMIEFEIEGEETQKKGSTNDDADEHEDNEEKGDGVDATNDDKATNDDGDGGDVGDDDGDGEAKEDDGEDDERAQIRERRRQERQERKRRAHEREETLRRELSSSKSQIEELRSKLDAIERRNSDSDIAQVSVAKEDAARAYNHFKEQVRVGTETNNGAMVAEATEKMMLARQRFNELVNVEKAYAQRRSAPPALDPRVLNNAQTWAEKNKWYDPRGKDPDSRIVLTLDQSLADDGYNPTTAEYWEELDARIKKYLPHRASRATVQPKPKSVVPGGGRESRAGKPSVFRLSSERVQALKDAGKWDDPIERNKMIKQYRDYDRANGSN